MRQQGIRGTQNWSESEVFSTLSFALNAWRERIVNCLDKANADEIIALAEALEISWESPSDSGAFRLGGSSLRSRSAFPRETAYSQIIYALHDNRKLLEPLTSESDPEKGFILAEALAISEQIVTSEGVETEFLSAGQDSHLQQLALKAYARYLQHLAKAFHSKPGKVEFDRIRQPARHR